VNDLQGPSVDDLQLRLVAPGSSAIVLPAHRIAGGTQFTNTTFSTRGQSISTASPPYTGTFLAPELAGVIGSSLGGVWTLQVSDRTKGADGTPPSILGGWTLQTAEASCDPQLVARVSASTPIASPGAAVTFDASESTSPTVDSADLTYDWTVDGQEVLGGGPQITQSFLTRGVHTVSVSVSDGVLSEPATDQVTIAVSQPPVPAFTTTPASPATGDTVGFDASASADPDPAGSISSYQWDFDGDGTWDLTTASPTTPHVYLKSGTYQVRLGVTNDLGARATKVLPVTVANRPPVADFTAPAPAIRTAAAHFDASAASDPDGQVELYSWDWNGDGVYDETTTSPGVDHAFAADGSVAVALKVTDDEGATASTTRSVTVTDAPTVTLAADPESGRPGDVVTLSATAADPDGAPGGTDLTYAWDLDGQGGFEVPDSASPTTTTTFSTFADHVVRVRVTDAAGATAIASTTVKIVNNPPVPVLTATPNPVVAGQPVTFDASGSSDADGPIALYRFDLDGDGTYEVTTTDPVVSRSYPNAGRFTVRLQVADSDDARRATTLDLVVQDPPPPPPPPPPAGGGTGGDGSAGTGGSGGGGGYGGSSEPTGPFVPVLGGAPIQSLKAALKVGVGVLLKLDRTAGMTLRATVQPAEARRLGLTKARGKKARPVLVGKLSVVAAPAGERRFTLKLVSSVRKRLAKARRMTVVLDARVDDGKGHVVPLTRVVLLRR
jgi:PKD repeat protein